MPPFKRAILKITGELFQKDNDPINSEKYDEVAKKILQITRESKTKFAIVVGGGNIFRGRNANPEVDRSEADFAGMLATIMNGVLLREALTRNGAKDTRLMTAIHVEDFAEPYIKLKARHHLEVGRLVIIAGGLGKPFFSTDSAVAQYANELQCDIIFKASTVDGVYDSDPKTNPKAMRYETISYKEAINKRLKVMDQTAFAMCEESGIPIFVFDVENLAQLPKVLKGNYSFGTLISK
jgi:uridylate kinase